MASRSPIVLDPSLIPGAAAPAVLGSVARRVVSVRTLLLGVLLLLIMPVVVVGIARSRSRLALALAPVVEARPVGPSRGALARVSLA